MIFIIGLGAAGNKAVIKTIELEVVKPAYAVLINSTEKDIPDQYKDNSIIIGNSLKGCGKERKVSKDAMIPFLKETDVLLCKNYSKFGLNEELKIEAHNQFLGVKK